MKRNITLIFITSILVFACNQNNVPRTELAFNRVVADGLFTMFPGTLRVTSTHILLQDPFNREGFIRIYDRATGEEIGTTGVIGRGPGEWNMPDFSNVINDRFAVYDANLKQFIFVEVETLQNISNTDFVQKSDLELAKFAFFDESHYIVANWQEANPFEMVADKQVIRSGQYPLNKLVTNPFECFQGTIQVHPQKRLLVYTTFQNPYIALYQVEKYELNLIWENQFMRPEYSIIESRLQWGINQPDGVSDVAFTKDYIVCLVKDFKSEATGRSIESAPKAVYVFNYEGHLVHILDLPVHSVRLASDISANIFYSVGLEPDYCIVEYDLAKVGL